ncbi:hypothetical protein GGI15_000652 [Coemansia interrupta]|uniref:RNA helicase n=1 Tax=Coemansia interrupta TaxID=1126814 RepID=A0A9W8LPC6_9FUNG|nr:hypothetical protein GGI15_000652 [Coemansia interrupta]
MKVDGQTADTQRLEARIDGILKGASAGTAALSTPAMCQRLAQFAETARSSQQFEATCKMFGRFDGDALASVYQAVQEHKRTVKTDTERTGGGLIYVPKAKRADDERARAAEGKSALGLDRRAAELRRLAVQSMGGEKTCQTTVSSKREDAEDDQVKFRQPQTQTQASVRLRQKRPETPSHPGGLSVAAQRRLDEHRRRQHGSDDRSRRGLAYGSGRHRSRTRSRSRSDSRSDRRQTDRRRQGSRYRSRSRSRSRSQSPSRRWSRSPPRSHGRQIDSRRIDSRNRPRTQSTWDAPTPRRPTDRSPRAGSNTAVRRDSDDGPGGSAEARAEWERAQAQLDRDWYGLDEGGTVVDDAHNPFASYVEHDDRLEAKLLGQQAKRVTARQAQHRRDDDQWINSRLMQSGVMQAAGDADNDDDNAGRVHLLVHDVRPAFLEGAVLSRQTEMVQTVVDPTSDMAVFARKGSALVREQREKRERIKATRDAVNMAGTTLGNVLGVQDADGGSDGEPGDAGPEPTETAAAMASDFAKSKSIREQREFLPAFACREDLLRVIGDNQVTIVVGETGSGKTTQLAQYLHEAGYTRHGMVGCTQPRRVAAMSVARRVADEMGVAVGDTVGYAIRFEDCTSAHTKIKYMTEGVLLRETLTHSDLAQYSAVIMDEAHERTLNTDVLLGLLRRIAAVRSDLKIIVTSATMNAQRFATFFGNAPVFTIPGRTFPVDVMFSRTPCDDYVDSAVRQTLTVHLSQAAGDILVFMTGQEDIEACCTALRERLAAVDGAAPLAVLPIYSQLPADMQARIFAPSPVRKAVVATNIAETSLTVDGVRYVVDAGFSKVKVYNPRIGMDALQVTPISQASAGQRSGRAGRTAPGVAYRLYTEQAFRSEMFANAIPEIQRTNLAYVVMLLKTIGVADLLAFDFLDAPPRDTIRASMHQLWTLGALDSSRAAAITPLGRRMAALPLDPAPARMLVEATDRGCAAEVATIVAMLAVPSVFFRPRERLDEADAAREKFFVPESDHLTLLNVFNQWRANGCRDAWCVRHFLHAKSLRKARDVREQLAALLAPGQRHPELSSAGADWDAVRQCICSAYFYQAARSKSLGEYLDLRTGLPCHVHPTSALYGMGHTPDYIVYHELVCTSKEYMQCATAVDPRWLAEMGPMFFSVREPGSRKPAPQLQPEETMHLDDDAPSASDAAAAAAARRSKARSAIVTPGATPRFKTPRRRTNL